MSTLKVTNIQATGETASRAVSGVAAAWVQFDQSSTLVVNNSLNISSSVDIAGGKSSHNLTNSYDCLFYTTSAMGANNRTDSGYYEAEAYTKDAGTFFVYGHWQTTAYDLLSVSATTHGDLA